MAYPGTLDNVPDAPDGSEALGESTPTHTEHHQALVDELNLIEAELGTNPSGPLSTVAARFSTIEAVATAAGINLAAAEGDIAALESAVAGLGADARVFDVVAYGAVVNGSTNDTAAWQAAINAAATAGGGVVTSSRNGVSVISGALQDTSGANAQILLPAVDAVDTESISIVIRGLTPPPTAVSVIGATPVPDNHLVLKSTLSSGTGAVIGAQGPVGTYDGFTNVDLRVENLTIRTVSNPTLTGLDLRKVVSVDLDRVVVDCGSYHVAGLTEPTSTGSYGIRLPKNNNGAHVRLGEVDVIGFYTGFEIAEHATGVKVAAWGCKVAAEFDATNHASVFLRFMAVWCERGLKFTGAHAVDVWQFDIEHAASGWYTTDYDVEDASNFGSGFLRWWSVLAGTGPHNSFTKNGGTGLSTSRVGASIGSGGSSSYVYRDRLVAAAGNTTLTLGATPVTNSPLVWVNGTIKWPTTDYTVASNVLTFGSALSAADVVAVQYHSAASSASASALSTAGVVVNILDNYTRADSASSLGTTSTGSKTWAQHSGTWGIASNKGYVAFGVASDACYASVDSAVTDCTISTTLSAVAGVGNAGICFRLTDASNCYVVDVPIGSTAVPTLYKAVAGTYTSLATGSAVAFANGDILTVTLSGTSIVVKRNGSTIISTTDSTYTTQTKHGIYVSAPAGTSSPARHDDFSIQP